MKGKGLFIALAIIAALLGLYLAFKNKIHSFISSLKAGSNEVIKSDVHIDFAKNVIENESSGNSNSGSSSNSGGSSTYHTPVTPDPVSNVPKINFDPYQWNVTKVLKKGVKGNEVAVLQWNMNKYVPYKNFTTKLVEDGDFGGKTETALYELTKLKAITLTQAAQLMNKFG